MINNKAHKTVISALMLAMGIILPFFVSHGYGLMTGGVILPMHIPVLLLSFYCGPVYGGIVGFILPLLNSVITGMPVMFPKGITMAFELLTYGISAGMMHRMFKYSKKTGYIYLSLIISLVLGRVVYGLTNVVLMFLYPQMQAASVIAATITGIPGIIIQLIIIPPLVKAVLFKKPSAEDSAIKMIKQKEATCVVVKNNKIIDFASPLGIKYLFNLYKENKLEGCFVADTVIGKAAAMILTEGKSIGCYGETVSKEALKWLKKHKIPVTYENLPDYIINRTGDGMCPMEETVLDVENGSEAITLLDKKIKELQKLKENKN